MNLLKAIFLPVLLLSSGCNFGQSMEKKNQEDFVEMKSKFDSNLISHFPLKLTYEDGQRNVISAKTDVQKNDVGLFLYEYHVNQKRLDSVENYIRKAKVIGKYRPYDTCLFIVNRFETLSSAENYTKPLITDSSFIERNCYENMFPIPNFANYNDDEIISFGLDSSYTIYVLEAKPGKYFEKYNLEPFDQMPKKWANGYSKGIAISDQNRTVIYWSIIW